MSGSVRLAVRAERNKILALLRERRQTLIVSLRGDISNELWLARAGAGGAIDAVINQLEELWAKETYDDT